ncbi:MAG: flagellar hook-associated family protein [Mesorhizobium sp.]|nr:flagellar hook-associated family protein [Mesorhizobium sp.]MBL8577518.1 flagellar hook-associated family protein [Mesorhizobium sp.]
MKTTLVSTFSSSQSLRYSTMRTQVELVKAQQERDTGKVFDSGIALGARTAQTVSFARDVDRLNGIVDSNGIVSARLKATQDALTSMTGIAEQLLGVLTASASGDAAPSVTRDAGKSALAALTSVLNTPFNGEYVFAGINTDVKPIDAFASGSPAKAAFDTAFQTFFGFSQTAPAAANISAADMETFITSTLEPQFLGAGWQANWSSATDQTIVSRIALNETASTSVSGNNDAIRKLAMAAASIGDLFDANLSEAGRNALVNQMVGVVGEAIASLAAVQSETGVVEQRVEAASSRIKVQADLFERLIIDTEGVDPYEAASRVSDLLSQLETSYAITARIQQLSLLRFLG